MDRLNCNRWQLVYLQEPSTPTDGNPNPTYSDGVRVYAEINGNRGTEGLRGDEVDAIGAYRILLRYRDDVKPNWRIKWGSRYLNIVTLWDEDGTRQWLRGTASEQLP